MFTTDRASFGMTVNGTDMMIGADNLQYAWAIESAHSTRPSLSVAFLDNKQAAGSWATFSDGAPIVVTMGDGQGNTNTYQFVQYGVDSIEPRQAGDLIKLSGVANVVPWFASVANKPYKGNASDAITQAAQDGGIQNTDVDSTQDQMTWHPDNRTLAQWARRVCDHAYMGGTGSPLLALTSQGGDWLLRMKDIMQQGSPQLTFVSAGLPGAGSDPSMPMMWGSRVQTFGGALGGFSNYGLQQVTQDLGGDVLKMFQLSITSLVAALGISQQLAQQVQVARVLYPSASIGNTHANFDLAYHMNTKSRATYTTQFLAMVNVLTPLRVLDDVAAQVANSAGLMDPAYSMPYKVSAITRGVERGSWKELHTLTSQGNSLPSGGGS